jgi:hypothetical protein
VRRCFGGHAKDVSTKVAAAELFSFQAGRIMAHLTQSCLVR